MSTCRCKGIAAYCCSHWTTGPLTRTELEFGAQQLGLQAGVKPDPKRELWSAWKWTYLV